MMGKIVERIKTDNEKAARMSVVEELFYDFGRSKAQVYGMNFVRGIFFGLGSVLGGTIVVGLLIWLLSAFVNVFPSLADFVNGVIDAMNRRG